jgi:hypothetical protein
VFAGWDWATGSHDVTVMDNAGARVDRWSLAHTEAGMVSTLARPRRHGDPACLPVAIETTRGLVVDRLLAAGHLVIPIHPNAFNAVRPRWGAARATSDPGDSFTRPTICALTVTNCGPWPPPSPRRWSCKH